MGNKRGTKAIAAALALGAAGLAAAPAGAAPLDTHIGNCTLTSKPSIAINGTTLSTKASGYCNTPSPAHFTLWIQYRTRGSNSSWSSLSGGQSDYTDRNVHSKSTSHACVSGDREYRAVASYWHDGNNVHSYISDSKNLNCK